MKEHEMQRSARTSSLLATADQQAVETLAETLVGSPEVTRQKEDTKKYLLTTGAGATPDGKATVARAVDEFAFLAALGAVNSDPARPKLVWAFPPPLERFGHTVPGSRWGIDNPDHVYRFIPIDGASKYVINARSIQPGPTQFSILLYQSYLGEDGKEDTIDTPVAGLRDRDIKREADGSFTVTVDSDPANGRPNHIQSNSNVRILWVRNTFSDWTKQNPLQVTVRRIGGPEPAAPASERATAERAAVILKAAAETVMHMVDGQLHGLLSGFALHGQFNVVSKPIFRGGAWGFMAPGNFKLADDEALVVTVDPLGAAYQGFQLSDPWTLSLDIAFNGSSNNHQALANQDGTYTYVISVNDPGVPNWLETSGLHDGLILIRWQVLPETIQSADGAVREVKLVNLADLHSALPSGMPRVNPAERKKASAERVTAYERRYAVRN